MADEMGEMVGGSLRWLFTLLGCSTSRYLRKIQFQKSCINFKLPSLRLIVDENKVAKLRTDVTPLQFLSTYY